jgi:GTP-binding protein YchF
MFNPRKKTYAKVTFADIAGLEEGVARKGLPPNFIGLLSRMDALVHVLRGFPNPAVPPVSGKVDPARDLAVLEAEFLLHDLGLVEKRSERIAEGLKKGALDRERALAEKVLFERLQDALEQEQPLRELPLAAEEIKTLKGYGFLSLKPVLILVNTGDDGQAPPVSYDHPQSRIVHLSGKLESELAELPPEEAELFKAEFGISELSRGPMIRLSYSLLGLQSFFTVGEDEVRAWTIRLGGTALEAAGAIHSDLAKGFIRAEVIGYDELAALGGLTQAKNKGRLRLEGKDYPVQDGEIVHIRHNL